MNIVKKLRLLSGLTRYDASIASGLSIEDITRIEKSNTPPPSVLLDLYTNKTNINSKLLYLALNSDREDCHISNH